MRYSLRRLVPSDASALFELMEKNRDRLVSYFPLTVAQTSSVGATSAFLQAAGKLADAKVEFLLGMYEDELLIGLFFIKTIDWRVPKCELVYCIDKDLEGKGIMSLFLQKVLDHCSGELRMHKVFLLIGVDNQRSKKLAESAGFILEGIHLEDYRTGKGDLADLAHYALIFKKGRKG